MKRRFKKAISVMLAVFIISCSAPLELLSQTGVFKFNLSYAEITANAAATKKIKNLKAGSVKSTSLKLTWSKISGAVNYQIRQYNKHGKSWTTIKTTDKTGYTVKSLKADTYYLFRIRALNSKKKVIAESSSLKVKTAKSTSTLLKSYYKKNFVEKNSGMYIYDFNKDGKKEMFVASFKNGLGDKASLNLYLYAVKGGKVKLLYSRKLNDSKYKNYGLFSEDHNEKYVEVYVNTKGYVCVDIFARLDVCWVNYFVFDLRKDKITSKIHLLDPGYTCGTGLYYYDKYPDDPLYDDEMGMQYGKYSSYSKALSNTIGKYGFSFKKHKFSHEEKYIVSPSKACKKLYSYNSIG